MVVGNILFLLLDLNSKILQMSGLSVNPALWKENNPPNN